MTFKNGGALSVPAIEGAYIAFEYCKYGDLFQLASQSKTLFKPNVCHTLFYQILKSVDFLHSACELAHNDLKLENFVVDEYFRVKLIDFAFCEKIGSLITKPRGTLQYLSPEALQTLLSE